jgi:hypothetical protein
MHDAAAAASTPSRAHACVVVMHACPQVLDRIAMGLPSKIVLPSALACIERSITHEDHACRAAACNVLGVMAEGCGEGLRLKGRIARVLPAVTQCISDAHSRVRAAAASCIAEMACAPSPHAEACHACVPCMCAMRRHQAFRTAGMRAMHACHAALTRSLAQVTCSQRCRTCAMW